MQAVHNQHKPAARILKSAVCWIRTGLSCLPVACGDTEGIHQIPLCRRCTVLQFEARHQGRVHRQHLAERHRKMTKVSCVQGTSPFG